MRNKNIVKVLSLFASVCIVAGCNESTTEEIATTTVQATVAVTSTAENTTAAEETDSAFPELADEEIDYIDENGEIFYKNPTEWTFEKVFDELRINGKRIEAPLTFDKLGEGFEFSDDEYDTTYSSSNGKINKMLKLKDKYLCSVTFIDCIDENDYNKPFHALELSLAGTNEENRDNITINGIGIGSTVEETIEKFGIPYSRWGDSLIYTAADVNKTFGTISLAFYEGKIAVMVIGLYDVTE